MSKTTDHTFEPMKQTFHSAKHLMYVKDADGEWVLYMQGKNLRQVLNLFDKHGDEEVLEARIQQMRVVTTVITEPYIQIDPLDAEQVDAALRDDKLSRVKTREQMDRRKKKRGSNDHPS
jgi:hypothetical protein